MSMARIQRRISHVKGLQTEIDNQLAIADLTGDMALVDGSADYDVTSLTANAAKTELDKKVNILDIVDDLVSTNVDKPLSANQGKALKDIIDGLSGGLVYKGGFDASSGVLPADVTQGWLYKITVAGTIDGVEMEVNDTIFANKTVVGASAGTDWDKIDNTESADILRDGDTSLDADWDVDTSKYSDRATTKAFVEDTVDAVTVKFTNETVTLAGDTATLVNTVKDNCIFMGTASILNADGTYDIVECTVAGSLLTVTPTIAGEYDGLSATVSYAYVPTVI